MVQLTKVKKRPGTQDKRRPEIKPLFAIQNYKGRGVTNWGGLRESCPSLNTHNGKAKKWGGKRERKKGKGEEKKNGKERKEKKRERKKEEEKGEKTQEKRDYGNKDMHRVCSCIPPGLQILSWKNHIKRK